MTDVSPIAPLASSKAGMVTSPHPIASETGATVLANGGNAIEAAIAMHFVLSVVYPHFTGIGGDAFFVIAAPGHPSFGISGIGQTGTIHPGPGRRFPDRGPKSMLTTACAVDACSKAYDLSRAHFGGLASWASLVDDAINLANAGFPVSKSQVFFMTGIATFSGNNLAS
jgi:oxamate amidohydrolase